MDLFVQGEYMERSLDASTLRQQIIANNMAHVNDPNYRGQKVEFEAAMQQAFNDWNQADTPEQQYAGQVESANTKPTVADSDSAKVYMNQEMTNLAKNQIVYQAVASQATSYYKALKYVIDNTGH